MSYSSSPQRYVLGIDIGGTKIDAQLFVVADGKMADEPIWKCEERTVKGVSEHARQMVKIIREAERQAHYRHGELVGAGIGSPGRFDADGRIKPGSNQNLGHTPDEFDGVNLRELYGEQMKRLKVNLPAEALSVCNDGNAMLAGLLESPGDLRNQYGDAVSAAGRYVAVLGIGTGIGHAIARTHASGGFDFVTDGHASALRVAVDAEDMPALLQAKTTLEAQTGIEEIMMFDDGTVRAEDLFRGPVVNTLAGVSHGRALDIDNSRHAEALAFAGKYMARTIAVIKSGESQDVEPHNGWSDDDKAQAAQTSLYLVSGGMGRSVAGFEMIRHAATEMERLGIHDIDLVQMNGTHLAARAAATMVPLAEPTRATVQGRGV